MTIRLTNLLIAAVVLAALVLGVLVLLHAGPFHESSFFVKRGTPIRLANMKSIHPF